MVPRAAFLVGEALWPGNGSIPRTNARMVKAMKGSKDICVCACVCAWGGKGGVKRRSLSTI